MFLYYVILSDKNCCTLQCTCTRGCIYSCCSPDDGCKKRPKHVQ